MYIHIRISLWTYVFIQFSSVAQSCPTLCDPMNHSTPGLPVHHQLRSSLRLTPIESVMPSSHLILCRPLLLLPPIPPSIKVLFSLLLDKCLGIELWVMVRAHWTLKETNYFPKWLYHFCIPASKDCSSSSTSSATLDFSFSNGNVVVSYCGFNLHFLNI